VVSTDASEKKEQKKDKGDKVSFLSVRKFNRLFILRELFLNNRHNNYTHTTILWLCGLCPGQPG